MIRPRRIAFIGNSQPRRCGIATFTTDLQLAVAEASPGTETEIVAMTDHGRTYDYDRSVRIEIRDNEIEDYVKAADHLNNGGFDVVSLQHEFGIFGGEAGSYILSLLSRLSVPVVTTMHTVLAAPSKAQRDVVLQIISMSAKIIVMAEKGRELLQNVYATPAGKIEVIAHGIPDFPFIEPDAAKEKSGFAGRPVILTFGLLSPNKGIEVMLDAMPSILKQCPDAVYVVLGATHPNLVRQEGEAYRSLLIDRALNLGISGSVTFLNQFVDRATLLEFISMCDVYVTPYLNVAQMTSGTLAYSFGLGKAVVSTPYWHAEELLANGKGDLVPFGDVAATSRAIIDLLTNEERRRSVRERAYASSRSMTWEHTAEKYLKVFSAAGRSRRPHVVPQLQSGPRPRDLSALEMRTSYFRSMCDDTGLFQHAVYCVPDRLHGYCVDDNARALLVACALNKPGETGLSAPVVAQFAAFIQHAWNPDKRRFRNFMSFDRRWLEQQGSEDSHGRTLWALGECARNYAGGPLSAWACELFSRALDPVMEFTSPRAWAFALLGIEPYLSAVENDTMASECQRALAGRLMTSLSWYESADWTWFENGLSYDNARLPQALLVTGTTLKDATYISAGTRSLDWLVSVQTAPSGLFRPVGSESFGDTRCPPRPFDQQPIEAAATVSACLAAWRAVGKGYWRAEAARAFGWFLGDNDLGLPLVDIETGRCRDGLHPDRVNENCGGESVVSYLLSLAEMRALARVSDDLTRTPSLTSIRA